MLYSPKLEGLPRLHSHNPLLCAQRPGRAAILARLSNDTREWWADSASEAQQKLGEWEVEMYEEGIIYRHLPSGRIGPVG